MVVVKGQTIKDMEITAKRLGPLIRELGKQMKKQAPQPHGLLMPISIRGDIDRKKYKGVGRPRNADYTRIPFPDYVGGEKVLNALGFTYDD